MRSTRRPGLLALLSLTLASTALALPQKTVHVDVHAAPGGDGSAGAPFQKIQDAIDAPTTVTGDTVLVAPGEYVGRVSMPFSPTVTVRSSGGPLETVIRASSGTETVRCDAGTLEGFTVLRPGGGSASARVVFCSAGWVRRCIVLGNASSDGVALDWFGSVSHCIVSECRNAVKLIGYPSGTISNSILRNNSHPTSVNSNSSQEFMFRYCIVDQVLGTNPSTNRDVAPLVRSFASRDFHLRSTSPCIDSGDPNAPLDPDGSRSDIGPLPFDPSWTPFEVYCTAKVNSLGCTPTIGAEGNASASAPVPFEITCSNVLNQRQGLLFYGFAPRATPYQGGFLCVASPTRRTGLLNSGGNVGGDDCTGLFAFDFNAHLQGDSDPQLEPGVEVFTQFWSRDPGASFGTNRSDALRFVVLP